MVAANVLCNYYTGPVSGDDTNRGPIKRPCTDDDEFNRLLEQRSAKRLKNDFDRYISVPNEINIKSSLGWYKSNQTTIPDLAKMARDVLAVPASGSAVERVFSVSGRIATWQRNRLSPEAISNMMMFKCGMKENKWVLLIQWGRNRRSIRCRSSWGVFHPSGRTTGGRRRLSVVQLRVKKFLTCFTKGREMGV